MPRFSYLMTYRESDANRRKNLDYIVQQLAADSTLQVIVVEQDASPSLDFKNHPHVTYRFLHNSGLFNKSWGLNTAASIATCERLVFADSDMLITAEAVDAMSALMDNGVDAINPYAELIDLNETESRELIGGAETIYIERYDEQLDRKPVGQHPPFCGGVFALTRKLFFKCGGFDERFEGWGGEDDAMTLRVRHFAGQIETLHFVAYHLWHKASIEHSAPPASYIKNLAYLTMYYERGDFFYRQTAQTDARRNALPTKYSRSTDVDYLQPSSELISCLCITRDRVSMLARAVRCFLAQNHPKKEMTIVCEADDIPTINYLQQLNECDINYHIVPVEPKLSLGELRNLSVELSNGAYVCQWDDDDWYHPERLSKQLEFTLQQNKPATVLARWLVHDRATDKIFCSNIRLWEGSLLCLKSALPSSTPYAIQAKGEDSKLIESLFIADQLSVADLPDLYVYSVHAANTFGSDHFEEILASSIELSPEDATRVRERLAN